MTLEVALRHVTHYRYDKAVAVGTQLVRLRPAAHCRTPLLSYSLEVTPQHFVNWQQDPFGNYIARLAFPDRASELRLAVDLVVDMVALNPFDFFLEEHAQHYPFSYGAELTRDLTPYLVAEVPTPRLRAWLDGLPSLQGLRTLDAVTDLNRRLAADIRYIVRLEPGVQTPEETLTLASGSCRDSAWLLVQIFRNLGLAARFVSGYLIQLTADQASLDGPSGPKADFCDLHAWAEVYIPGAGWIGLDPTSGLLAGEGHLPLACTPEPGSAAPITGTLEACEVSFDVTMAVTRLAESPRVTKPYSEDQWAAIDAAGEAVEARLQAGDVRLTMGGEPTFVSLDDRDGEAWHTAADSPLKRELAAQLIERLRARFAPEGSVHFSQGKWYPGEPLPRWAYSLFWREDGEALWQRSGYLAAKPGPTPSLERAHTFIEQVAKRLNVDPANTLPAYEDTWHYLATERRLPPDFDPVDSSRLSDPAARARLARTFEQGLGKPVSFVLPVQAWKSRDTRAWHSERWRLRGEHLFLVPGDSPAGLRLPLDALAPPTADSALAALPEVPFERAAPFAAPAANDDEGRKQATTQAQQHPGAGTGSRQQVSEQSARTALVVEPRDGFLYVFVPPIAAAEAYVELIGAIEAVAEALDQPVRLEGYDPPPDHRVRTLRVTPDPGVIEVNVAPAASWRELVHNTEVLYEEARLCRLTTEKFMLDGRHTGTGGGNHVVLGGPTPSDSAFLRRPDMLRSFVSYFNNHPSLSFLFSGMFIGPTSQAPRVDQARDDALYELEIACQQVPERALGDPPPPWLVDRIFRDVLVDVTGNTHRTEICIDKLFSPDSPTGRLGLVEFRGFEMPPHAQMALAQALLMRALTAWFWETPYTAPLEHFGTQLHDRFMLPHYLLQDFDVVMGDLRSAGLPLEAGWFAPHAAFRLPVLGSLTYQGLTLELRAGLEPWHVTGEHGVAGGTARYVDSSVERLQVQVSGLAGSRYAVACNGRKVPLQPTSVADTWVAGVRYRAWQPPLCLHPTLGVDVPLVFDIVDTWTGISVAGCTYHVSHLGGRSHETYPVNALEAEGRRLGRFATTRHSSGPIHLTSEPTNPSFPVTLDLRRKPRA